MPGQWHSQPAPISLERLVLRKYAFEFYVRVWAGLVDLMNIVWQYGKSLDVCVYR